MCQRLAGMDDRLHRWACWASARGTLHSAGVSSIYRAAEYVIGSDWDRSVSWSPRVNFDELEAQATDRAVLALAPAQRTVLIIVYVKCLGSTKEVQARHARLSRNTLHNRLCAIDVELARNLEQQRRAAQERRQAHAQGLRLG